MNLSHARLGRVFAIACAAVSVTACATVTRGTTEAWTVTSEPPGAKVKTTNGFKCDATPCTFKMDHKARFEATVSKKGYKTATEHVDHHFTEGGTAGLVGNVLIGGLIGIGVDAVTGATQGLSPNPLMVKLEPDTPNGAASDAPAPVAQTAPAPRTDSADDPVTAAIAHY